MKKLTLLTSFIIILICVSCYPSEPDSTTAISDVNIVDVTNGEIKPSQTVIITGNYIAEIGPANSLAVPDEASVIDARGKYLIPGLWDMHVHTMASTKDAMPLNNLLIANGITGIRGPGANNQSLAEMIRPAIQLGQMAGPARMNIAADIVYGTYARNPDLLSARTSGEGLQSWIPLSGQVLLSSRCITLLTGIPTLP